MIGELPGIRKTNPRAQVIQAPDPSAPPAAWSHLACGHHDRPLFPLRPPEISRSLAACQSLGEARYAPDFDPANFDDPKRPTNPNPYFPRQVGNTWEYRGGGEVNVLKVLNRTKLIAGVNCLVVRDQVFTSGNLVEDTDDGYASAKDGTTWYCGEEVKDLESFEGDNPKLPELVKIDGSFKAGRDRDKPGIIFQAAPKAGQLYLEEFSLGNAEDMTEILSTTYKFGVNHELDRGVPKALAQQL
jgi:hypothetical protein